MQFKFKTNDSIIIYFSMYLLSHSICVVVLFLESLWQELEVGWYTMRCVFSQHHMLHHGAVWVPTSHNGRTGPVINTGIGTLNNMSLSVLTVYHCRECALRDHSFG